MKILFVSGTDDHLSLGSLVEPIKKAGYDVEESIDAERLSSAMINEEVDLVVIWGPIRWFTPSVLRARRAGSEVPVIHIWTGTGRVERPYSIPSVTWIKAPVLPSKLLAAIRGTQT